MQDKERDKKEIRGKMVGPGGETLEEEVVRIPLSHLLNGQTRA